jgi:hypothetical protein
MIGGFQVQQLGSRGPSRISILSEKARPGGNAHNRTLKPNIWASEIGHLLSGIFPFLRHRQAILEKRGPRTARAVIAG